VWLALRTIHFASCIFALRLCALLYGQTQLGRAAKENNVRKELYSLPWVWVRMLTSTQLVFLNLRANLRKDLVERRSGLVKIGCVITC
jgi:hypothetical protein